MRSRKAPISMPQHGGTAEQPPPGPRKRIKESSSFYFFLPLLLLGLVGGWFCYSLLVADIVDEDKELIHPRHPRNSGLFDDDIYIAKNNEVESRGVHEEENSPLVNHNEGEDSNKLRRRSQEEIEAEQQIENQLAAERAQLYEENRQRRADEFAQSAAMASEESARKRARRNMKLNRLPQIDD